MIISNSDVANASSLQNLILERKRRPDRPHGDHVSVAKTLRWSLSRTCVLVSTQIATLIGQLSAGPWPFLSLAQGAVPVETIASTHALF